MKKPFVVFTIIFISLIQTYSLAGEDGKLDLSNKDKEYTEVNRLF